MFKGKENIKNSNAGSVSQGRRFFQPKLSVNQPNDIYEQEADTTADRVMRMSDKTSAQQAFFKPAGSYLQCKESDGNGMQSNNQLDSYVGSLGSAGQALPESSRKFFEPRFGQDFSKVKIHTDTGAAKSAQSINALAYTTGNNIVFNTGQFSPESESGKKLMAHELTHVVQQSANNSTIQRSPNPPGWDELHNYKHPGSVVVKLTHFKTSNASSDPFNDYAAKAKTLLQQHNLGLDVVEGGEINFQKALQDLDDVKNLRMEAHKKFQDTTPRLPVISAVYSTLKGFDASDLNGQTVKNTDWLPFVILNSANKSKDSVTLLHETGHAANVPGNVDLPVGPNDIVQNFMLYGDDRTDMLKQQVIAIAKAYFSG